MVKELPQPEPMLQSKRLNISEDKSPEIPLSNLKNQLLLRKRAISQNLFYMTRKSSISGSYGNEKGQTLQQYVSINQYHAQEDKERDIARQ